MLTYYPYAKIIYESQPEPDNIATYDPVNSIEKCFEQFRIWRDHYGFTFDCGIQVFKDGKPFADMAIDWNPEP